MGRHLIYDYIGNMVKEHENEDLVLDKYNNKNIGPPAAKAIIQPHTFLSKLIWWLT